MGNLFSSCCDKKQHTPYDPFIYDEDYEEYHSPNVLNPNLINTYDPPPSILMDQYSNSASGRNSESYTSHDIRDSYYEDHQQPPHRQNVSDYTYPPSNRNNKYSSTTDYEPNSYQPFDEGDNDAHDDRTLYNAEHPNLNNVTETLNHSIPPQHQQPTQLWQTKIQTNSGSTSTSTTSTGSDKQSLQHSANAQDKFYPRYMNFTESVYMAQPPSSELGITDSIVDSIVLGLDNQKPPREQHFNTQHMQQQQQLQNSNVSPQQRQQQQPQNNNNSNLESSYISESSSPMTDSNFGSSIYYDTQNSF